MNSTNLMAHIFLEILLTFQCFWITVHNNERSTENFILRLNKLNAWLKIIELKLDKLKVIWIYRKHIYLVVFLSAGTNSDCELYFWLLVLSSSSMLTSNRVCSMPMVTCVTFTPSMYSTNVGCELDFGLSPIPWKYVFKHTHKLKRTLIESPAHSNELNVGESVCLRVHHEPVMHPKQLISHRRKLKRLMCTNSRYFLYWSL